MSIITLTLSLPHPLALNPFPPLSSLLSISPSCAPQGSHRLELVPLSEEGLNQSQEEFVPAENEPNNHLYSLGKFVHAGLNSRRLVTNCNTSHATPSPPEASNSPPTSSGALPPRQKTVGPLTRHTTAVSDVAESGSGSEAASSLQLDSSTEYGNPVTGAPAGARESDSAPLAAKRQQSLSKRRCLPTKLVRYIVGTSPPPLQLEQ